MQFMVLVSLNPKASNPPPKELGEAEAEAVRGLYMEGLIRQIWVRADGSGACIIAEASTAEVLAEKLSGLPLVRAGILQTPEIVPLAPYWGFAPRA
jgi:Muconolactone delta-isomerase